MKVLVKILIYFVFGLRLAQAAQVICYFMSPRDVYNCKMMNSMSDRNLPLTSVIGSHANGKENANVEVFYVTSQTSPTKYLPIESCLFFKSLQMFEVESINVVEISRRVFHGCTNVKTISIRRTLISYLSIDIFNDLTNLVDLTMDNNKIVFLPENLFSMNSKLKTINFDKNRLAIINTIVPSTVSSISLKSNTCINKKFPEKGASLASVSKVLSETCIIPDFEKEKDDLKSRIGELKAELIVKVHKIDQLEDDKKKTPVAEKLNEENERCIAEKQRQQVTIDDLKNALKISEDKITLLETETTELRSKIDKVTLETQTLSLNLSQSEEKAQQLLSEISDLKLNISQSEIELNEKTKSLLECSSERIIFSETLSELHTNLSDYMSQNDLLSVNLTKCDADMTEMIKGFNTTMEAQMTKISELLQTQQETTLNFDSLIAQSVEFSSKLSDCETDLSNAAEEIDVCRDENLNLNETLQSLEANSSALLVDFENKLAQLSALETKLKDEEKKIIELEKEKELLNIGLTATKSNISEISKMYSEQKSQVFGFLQHLQSQTTVSTRDDVENLAICLAKNIQMNKTLLSLNEKISRLSTDKEYIAMDIGKLEQEIIDVESECNSKVDDLKNELKGARANLTFGDGENTGMTKCTTLEENFEAESAKSVNSMPWLWRKQTNNLILIVACAVIAFLAIGWIITLMLNKSHSVNFKASGDVSISDEVI